MAVQALATMGTPLVKNGTLVAVLVAHAAVPRHWNDEEVALLQETAERTWATVERARAEGARRESERRLQMLAESVPVVVWMSDAAGSVT